MLYELIARLLTPAAWWGRMKVEGVETVPSRGPVLLVPNHDSQWDPVVAALALRRRRRLRFLARADLWRIFGLGPVLTAIGQIPIERGAGDETAIESAVGALRDGGAVCVFPEGRLSRGRRLPARSGVARLAQACPEAGVVLCAIAGTTDYVRFPSRPCVAVTFFGPAVDPSIDGAPPREVAAALLRELRKHVPPVPAGRSRAAAAAG
jgi:1-acyl-sn-glycerol-3-phosphate acyltransferase